MDASKRSAVGAQRLTRMRAPTASLSITGVARKPKNISDIE